MLYLSLWIGRLSEADRGPAPNAQNVKARGTAPAWTRALLESVADAFAVRHADAIAGGRVLLIDDVFTTGATASSCAAALNAAGAEGVFVLTIARALPDSSL